MFLIEKTSFDVRVLGKTDGFQLQNDLTRWFYGDLLNDVEDLLKRYDQKDMVIKMPLIKIDIDVDSSANLLDNIKTNILAQIETHLKSFAVLAHTNEIITLERSEQIISENIEKSNFNIWLYFLEHGHLPSTALTVDDEKMPVAVAETLSAGDLAERKLKHIILNNSTALYRLILQHDEFFLATILGIFLRRDVKSISEWRKIMEVVFMNMDVSLWTNDTDYHFTQTLAKSYTKVHFWTLVFESVGNPMFVASNNMEALDMVVHIMKIRAKTIAQNGSSITQNFSLTAFCQQLIENQVFKSYSAKKQSIEKSIKKIIKENAKNEYQTFDLKNSQMKLKELEQQVAAINKKNNSDLPGKQTASKDIVRIKDVFYIKNAGVVICHSFLLSFFDNLGLIGADKKFKDESAQHKAIHMIEHLATGDTFLPEYRLILGKILCGLPLDIPLDRDIIIYEGDQKESVNLLEAILQHWSILGSTNIEALRQGFFFRDGKLSHNDKGWLLQVEQRTEDILLSRLPWGLGMIKLPFMKEILTVEWA